jgi:hypothetical protein
MFPWSLGPSLVQNPDKRGTGLQSGGVAFTTKQSHRKQTQTKIERHRLMNEHLIENDESCSLNADGTALRFEDGTVLSVTSLFPFLPLGEEE